MSAFDRAGELVGLRARRDGETMEQYVRYLADRLDEEEIEVLAEKLVEADPIPPDTDPLQFPDEELRIPPPVRPSQRKTQRLEKLQRSLLRFRPEKEPWFSWRSALAYGSAAAAVAAGARLMVALDSISVIIGVLAILFGAAQVGVSFYRERQERHLFD